MEAMMLELRRLYAKKQQCQEEKVADPRAQIITVRQSSTKNY